MSASHLDRALAAGADPESSPALKRRAGALAKPAFRAELARGLREAVLFASRPRRGLSSRVPISRAACSAAADLEGLSADLERGNGEISARRAQGLALTRLLLVDGNGPLYRSGSDSELLSNVRAAREALAPNGRG